MSKQSGFVIKNGVLKKYKGLGGDVVIPAGVTYIDKAFWGCRSLTSVTIPDSVTSIGTRAFDGCSSLTGVTIPEGVTSIGEQAFCSCRSLASVTIPASVTSIGDRAFFGCHSMTDVTIPAGVTSIGDQAFCECGSLKSATILGNVTSIGSGVFQNCGNLTSIAFLGGITSIGDRAFFGYRSLTSITIPEGVTSIGRSAFSGCSSLTSITIPDSVTYIHRAAFSGCSSLTSVTIPAGVTRIDVALFVDCTGLTSVTIPEGVTSIGDYAFSGCSSLTGVTIPDGVTSIGERAFEGCSLSSVKIPEGVTSIGDSAFRGCTSLTSLTIPDSVTSIGNMAFYGCGSLTSVFTSTRLSMDMFDETPTCAIITDDPGLLPVNMKPLAAIGFAEHPDDSKSERGKKHLKYIKSNAAKLVKEAFAHPALLQLMCDNKLLTPEVTETYLAAAQEAGSAELTAVLLDYQQNKLTGKEKAKAAQKAEVREEKVTDFVFSVEALEQLQGKVFVVTGKLNTFSSRDECKACLDACGAVLSETLNAQTDYLITNTPDSGSAKNKKAEALGVKKLSEAEFNRLIGRQS